ncbi:hypothetical protein [Pararobbsia alpina]|uniref:Uncharacterized protein n=1 Tax=Pararobbsia alpina TaxID=621374 RepID=A0A6S7BD66_9BURK|nr:hypothetical protein [Pararobbsia alpina]CAB3795440.1 hypothetical protein LMG28138_03880 [Pararobbsia alpina]
MPFSLPYVVPTTGAPASYHEVSQITLDKASLSSVATIGSYVSADTKTAGKLPLYTQQIQISGLPDSTDPFQWCEQMLIEAAPDQPTSGIAPNRYTFAGGTMIEADAPTTT